MASGRQSAVMPANSNLKRYNNMSEQSSAQAALVQPEEGIEPDDLNTTMIVTIGLVSSVLVLASVLGVTAMVDYYQAGEVDQKVNAAVYELAKNSKIDQENKLNEYSQPDPTAEVYSIPITLAKKLVVSELQEKASDN